MKKILFIILLLIACNDSLSIENQDCKGEIIGGYCYGCTDPNACNWDPTASRFDDSCTYIPDGACDCDGNVYDCLGVCGGNAIIDSCEVCGGEGAIYQCGCTDIPEGDCDCDGNVEDCAGVCGGNCEEGCDCAGVCGGNTLNTVTCYEPDGNIILIICGTLDDCP